MNRLIVEQQKKLDRIDQVHQLICDYLQFKMGSEEPQLIAITDNDYRYKKTYIKLHEPLPQKLQDAARRLGLEANSWSDSGDIKLPRFASRQADPLEGIEAIINRDREFLKYQKNKSKGVEISTKKDSAMAEDQSAEDIALQIYELQTAAEKRGLKWQVIAHLNTFEEAAKKRGGPA